MAAQGESEKAMLSGNPDILKRITRFRLESSRSEEHTSELQSLTNLVCRLLLEKKKKDGHRLMGRSAGPPDRSRFRRTAGELPPLQQRSDEEYAVPLCL